MRITGDYLMRASDRLRELCADAGWSVEQLCQRCQEAEYSDMRTVILRAMYQHHRICEIVRATGLREATVRYHVFTAKVPEWNRKE